MAITAGTVLTPEHLHKADSDEHTSTINIGSGAGAVDLQVEVVIHVGLSGVAIVTQQVSWEADTASDTRALDLVARWTGANTGDVGDHRLRTRSAHARHGTGTRESHVVVVTGLNSGSTAFTQAASISTDDLIVYRSALQVVTF